ncbi:MAG TPA: DNA repair protein RecN [Rectinemataceae bacterium]
MLERLSVRDFALIDEVELEFGPGLSIFTGETGTGKSLVVGALSFLFGERADTESIREGAEECSVSATLALASIPKALAWLEARDIEAEEGRVVLRRGMKRSGRSYAYIQSQAVSRSELAEFTGIFADLHGQHEHQSLMDESRHLGLLDGFACNAEALRAYFEAYTAWTSLGKEYKARKKEAEQKESAAESLAAASKEIRQARIKPGEDEALSREEKILSQHERLFAEVQQAFDAISPQQGTGALALLRKARLGLDAASDIDPRLGEQASRLQNLSLDLEDVASSLASSLEKIRFDPERLEAIQNRQAELKRLKRRYGQSLEAILEMASRAESSLRELDTWAEERSRMEARLSELRNRALALAETLSERRKHSSSALAARMEAVLARLGMGGARFSVQVETRKNEEGKIVMGPLGKDEVAFLLAPNPGEGFKPLSRIASGGELSRLALALRVVLSAGDSISTLIFDEIDTGIGGEVALAVGEYLREISASRQVLCVTHLATIAARADTHYRVEKVQKGKRTQTSVRLLAYGEREEEIARMLSGDKSGDISRAHAAELLSRKDGL